MILVTRINGKEKFYINENLIESIEETPDTLISMESGKKLVVMESAPQVLEKIFEQRLRALRFRDPT